MILLKAILIQLCNLHQRYLFPVDKNVNQLNSQFKTNSLFVKNIFLALASLSPSVQNYHVIYSRQSQFYLQDLTWRIQDLTENCPSPGPEALFDSLPCLPPSETLLRYHQGGALPHLVFLDQQVFPVDFQEVDSWQTWRSHRQPIKTPSSLIQIYGEVHSPEALWFSKLNLQVPWSCHQTCFMHRKSWV